MPGGNAADTLSLVNVTQRGNRMAALTHVVGRTGGRVLHRLSGLVLQVGLTLAVAVPAGAGQQGHHHAAAAAGAAPARLANVVANDNRKAAGTLADGVLTIQLRAGTGTWRPEGEQGAAIEVQAFGEATAPLTAPAPLIRVPEGTEVRATVRNDLSDTLRVFGLCEHTGTACPPLEVPPGQTARSQFRSGSPGTYHYWATTSGMPLSFRADGDTQLSGGFIVDAPGADPDADRVFVITEWSSITREQLAQVLAADDPGKVFLALKPKVLFLINGAAWPHTERLKYQLDEEVRWRVINLSTQTHPMHLHGFYFDVDSVGNGVRDTHYGSGERQRVVTQLMSSGGTMAMTWRPERAGNWLFHCHVMTHVSPVLAVDGSPLAGGGDHAGHSASAGMTGMVLGITVVGPAAPPPAAGDTAETAARKLTLLMRSEPARYGDAPAYGFVLADQNHVPSTDRVPVPGPNLILTRGEPVEITLVNQLPESTAIHWHGMELESYYDGVHAWGGDGQQVTPMIEPGESFVVRFTPPHTGTFMYHTHLHDNRQLTSGLYGAMLVVEPGETIDEATDHVFVIGRGGPERKAAAVLNGDRAPQFVWAAGVRHRIRLINITPGDIFSVSLQTPDGPVSWKPLTKDGAPLPADRCQSGPARLVIGVGETYDFEYTAPPGRRNIWLEVRGTGGAWQVQGQVILK
jgi:FtsP/CotA-like multicopper oxidase with cupredoxin domain